MWIWACFLYPSLISRSATGFSVLGRQSVCKYDYRSKWVYQSVWRYACVPNTAFDLGRERLRTCLFLISCFLLINMTFLPVPKQTSLFMAAWLSRLLSYSQLAFTFLSPLPLLCLCSPSLFLLTPLSRAQQPLSDGELHDWYMAGAWLAHAWGVIRGWSESGGGRSGGGCG